MGLKRYGCYSTWSFNSFNFFTFLTFGVEKLCLLAYLISSLFQPGSWADHWEGFGRVWRSSSNTCPAHGWRCPWCHQKSSGGTCKGLFNLTETERTFWFATYPGCCPCYAQFSKYLGSVSCSRYTYCLLNTFRRSGYAAEIKNLNHVDRTHECEEGAVVNSSAQDGEVVSRVWKPSCRMGRENGKPTLTDHLRRKHLWSSSFPEPWDRCWFRQSLS